VQWPENMIVTGIVTETETGEEEGDVVEIALTARTLDHDPVPVVQVD
jgi:hypothetical protein